jgi:hypothetical protein
LTLEPQPRPRYTETVNRPLNFPLTPSATEL